MVMIQTGKVVNGRVVVADGDALEEGAVVAIVSRGPDESFELTQAQEDELARAVEEVERGEVVGIDELYREMRELRARYR